MNKTRTTLTWFAFLAAVSLTVPLSRSAGDKVFEGEIADTQCALGVHSLHRSHKEMIAMGEAGSTWADHGMRWDNSGKNGHYASITWSNA